MSFPTSPINGQETTINGITYIFSSSNNAWTRKPRQLFTAGVNAPANPAAGDQWYDTSDDILYQYLNDGTNNYWVDIRSGIFGGNSATLGETLIQGNLIPVANVVYSLGNTTNRFKDLFLSGSTIDLGGATIKTDATSGAIALIPQPTVANPNPTGIVVSPSGTVSTVSTTGGTLATNAISNSSNTAVTTNTTTFGNITSNGNVVTANVYADRFFYSNGTAFSSSSFGNTDIGLYLLSSNAVVGTSAINVPSGNTAQRPGSPMVGMIRYNTSLNRFEGYLPAGGWQSMLSDAYSIDYIIVAGGGAGGVWHAGGGGGGGVVTATAYSVTPNNSYPISVGAGGSGGSNPTTVVGTNGTDSTGFGYTAIGGGRGGNYNATAPASGGSGAGGNGDATYITGAAGTVGQGYAGGDGKNSHAGGGGGGGGGIGQTAASASVAGDGGVGYLWLNGSYYAGGGGGGTWPSSSIDDAGAGGSGGGGRGSYGSNTYPPTAGTVNTGGGGGGHGGQGNNTSWAAFIAGGSGVVIVRYLGTQRGTGGTVTSASGYTYHTFTGTGSFTA